MSDNHAFSIIIITWNSSDYLPKCLFALSIQTFQDFEIIVIDNGSTDGTVDLLETSDFDLKIKLIKLEKNLGFAAANNLGALHSNGILLALLNTDAFPESKWLEKLFEASNKHPEFSCFSSRQIQANNPMFLTLGCF